MLCSNKISLRYSLQALDENDEWQLLEAVDGDALSRFPEEDKLSIP